jgi:hypothetical protein
MPLDLNGLQPDIEQMIARAHTEERGGQMRAACELLRGADTTRLRQALREREQQERIPWLVARPLEEVATALPAPALPVQGFTVVGSDGSSIAPDRHSPLRFFVLNMGLARLTYGPTPMARLWSRSSWHAEERDLYVMAEGRRIPVDGARLGLAMAVEELAALWEATLDAPQGQPVLALRDGSLILWALQSEDAAVVERFLPPFLEGLKRFQMAGIPLVSYISYPGSQDVANSLRRGARAVPGVGRLARPGAVPAPSAPRPAQRRVRQYVGDPRPLRRSAGAVHVCAHGR